MIYDTYMIDILWQNHYQYIRKNWNQYLILLFQVYYNFLFKTDKYLDNER